MSFSHCTSSSRRSILSLGYCKSCSLAPRMLELHRMDPQGSAVLMPYFPTLNFFLPLKKFESNVLDKAPTIVSLLIGPFSNNSVELRMRSDLLSHSPRSTLDPTPLNQSNGPPTRLTYPTQPSRLLSVFTSPAQLQGYPAGLGFL